MAYEAAVPPIAIFLIFLAAPPVIDAKYYCTYYNSENEPYQFTCSYMQYCCGEYCCTKTYSFYRLWYFWLFVTVALMFCSGGSYWYKRHYPLNRQQPTGMFALFASRTVPPTGTSLRQGGVPVRATSDGSATIITGVSSYPRQCYTGQNTEYYPTIVNSGSYNQGYGTPYHDQQALALARAGGMPPVGSTVPQQPPPPPPSYSEMYAQGNIAAPPSYDDVVHPR